MPHCHCLAHPLVLVLCCPSQFFCALQLATIREGRALSVQASTSVVHLPRATQPPLGTHQARTGNVRAYAAMADAPASGREQWLGTGFEVYKGKAAAQFKPIAATFRENGPGSHVLERQGVLFLEFANSVGTRSYDWQNKITFALSVSEMASIFMVPGALSTKGVSCFHDPGMQTDTQGQVRTRPCLRHVCLAWRRWACPDGTIVLTQHARFGRGAPRAHRRSPGACVATAHVPVTAGTTPSSATHGNLHA